MKNKLFYIIFKKELEEYYNQLDQKYKKNERNLNDKIEKSRKKYNLTKRIFKLCTSGHIIGVGENNNSEELFIVINNSKELLLFGESYQGMAYLPRIYFNIKEKECKGMKLKYLHIIDCLMEDVNIGNGSVAMQGLIKYAKMNDCKYISGCLSSVDDGHADRRDHFYEKFGFSIQDSRIHLDL